MNIYESITAAMAEGYAIGKDSTNKTQGFKYRGIDAVMNVFQPILAKYKIFACPEIINVEREERQTSKGGTLIYTILTVKYTFYAEDGSSVSLVVMGEGMDSGDKGCNKAMSIAFKYAMFQLFCIPTEEMIDPDAETPPPSNKKADPIDDLDKKATQFFGNLQTCEHCDGLIEGYSFKGRAVTAEEHIQRSKLKYGHVYCMACIKSNAV